MQSGRNYYEILGVSRNSTIDVIKQTYRKAALKYHPDLSNDEHAHVKMSELNEAYGTLIDVNKRLNYNATLEPTTITLRSNLATLLFQQPTLEEEKKYSLPLSMILNIKKAKSNIINVILLGKENIDRRAFIYNLYEMIPDPRQSSRTFGVDFKIYTQNDNSKLNYHIFNIPEQDRFNSVLISHFRQAACILIFDKLNFHLENCKQKMGADFDNCLLYSLSYHDNAENKCNLISQNILDERSYQNKHEESRDAYTAHLLSETLFSKLAIEIILKRIQLLGIKPITANVESVNLLDNSSEKKRPGCCK